ncbi:NUDIX hydrolase [Photobacterium angustum]|uniref:NUDIX hydrolase n=1 Tax=Photobacterium angustum TaxID=661 RepID=UPI0005E1C17C|nr:NUDIX domain-containing protein [Photobacterium angustum]KJF92842.1 NUDIX hydrolase [Photobacterium angustum]KJG04641.1 NUDIX hydrolase [Photobacterium angustum]PSV94517.1 NUDIX domain-containing protein [Photobacterium angustum]PSW81694.1 NUDIX domain-containing protein [Photobacterium angustum]
MNKVIDKLAWVLIKDGKFLVVRSQGKALFYLPGGKREAGESDIEALTREIKEEVSVDLIPSSIKYMKTFTAQADGKAEGISVKLTCYFSDYSGDLIPAAEIEEQKFIDSNDESLCSTAALSVLKWLEKTSLITGKLV